ncbi:MAG: hypothetical protein JKY12_02695 [Sneathiella sp.]|nr:hypothetical protein [Sneathiella sp.]
MFVPLREKHKSFCVMSAPLCALKVVNGLHDFELCSEISFADDVGTTSIAVIVCQKITIS